MKILYLFATFVAVAVAFPSGETQRELQTDEKNTLHSVEANPLDDKTENNAERAKRFIFPIIFASVIPSPVVYEPVAYDEVELVPGNVNKETRTVVKTVKTAPVVSTSVVKTRVSAPFVDVDVDV